MNRLFRLALIFAVALCQPAVTGMCQTGKSPTKIIFDTDMGGDCDDVGALFILHGAVARGDANLLATIGCISADAIAPALDAINTWFGHPEIPVGTLKDTGFLVGPHYTAEIARRFPHKFASGKDYPDAVTLYRQILAKQPDGSVVVLAVGPLRNLAHLLRSLPDAASPLDGRTLVAKKVKRLEIMGGNYPPDASRNDAEWNFKQDPASAAVVCSDWPTPVRFNGDGGSTNSGRRVTYEMPEHNPLTMAYSLYPGVGFAGDRLSWDPITSLVAVYGPSPWYEVVSGVNTVDTATGVNIWQAAGGDHHEYLALKAAKNVVETALEDSMVAGKGRPVNLTFNTAYYARAGMCQITSQGAVQDSEAASKAFDGDDQTGWLDKAASSWIQCQYVDGRKYSVTSYAVVCPDAHRLPRRLEISGSNDGGSHWTRLDTQEAAGFTAQTLRREFRIAKPAKWNLYRLGMTAVNANEGALVSEIELNEHINCRPGVAVTDLQLDWKAVTLPADGKATLNATLAPAETFEREVDWVSSNPAIAEVRRIGEQISVVVGKRPGRCILTARIGNLKQVCSVTVTASTLPVGWNYNEFNQPAIPGSALVSQGRLAISGCGHAMTSWWERVRDQGVFVSRAVSGNAEISARLISLAPDVAGFALQRENRPPTASGLMLRESLQAKCGRFLSIQVEASGALVCRWRDRTGDADDNQRQELGKVTLPVFLKLVQTGKQIQVFASKDGQTWGEPKMSHPAVFSDQSLIGLVVCSGNTFASTTAIFDSLTVR